MEWDEKEKRCEKKINERNFVATLNPKKIQK